MNTEVWRPVPGYDGFYEVSSHGRIRSLDRTVRRQMRQGVIYQRVLGKVLRASGKVYPVVQLCKGGIVATRYVHEIVAAVFLGPRPEGMQVCHDDGCHDNPRADNLRYDTPVGNAADRHRHGTDAVGSSNPMAILTDERVADLKRALKAKQPAELSRETGIPRTTLSSIKHQRTWAHVVV